MKTNSFLISTNVISFIKIRIIIITTTHLLLVSLIIQPSISSSNNISSPKNFFTQNDTLPQYALEFAPLVYLHSQEVYWPSEIDQHLANVQPEINFTVVGSDFTSNPLINNLDYLSSTNLQQIEPQQQAITYLTSIQPIFELLPSSSWLNGVGAPDLNGRSDAASIIIAVDKTLQVGPGWVDVFYLFFYSYNRGNYFYNNRFGDHVGDWENTMIRFCNGQPKYVVPEAHGGQVMLGNSAFDYDVLERVNGRPVVYSANGTHGMYPQAGQQNYTGLPVAIYDITDKGHLWDPILNYKSYFFSNELGFSYTSNTPIQQQDPQSLGWLKFLGYWGDQKYERSNPNQTCIGGMCFFDGGPLGPQAKSLGRGWICGNSDCKPQSTLPTILEPGAQRYNSPFSNSSNPRFKLSTALNIVTIISILTTTTFIVI